MAETKHLPTMQYDVVCYLGQVGHASTGAIASFLYGPSYSRKRGPCMRILNNLREKDLIGPTPAGTSWCLTEAGQAILEPKPSELSPELAAEVKRFLG